MRLLLRVSVLLACLFFAPNSPAADLLNKPGEVCAALMSERWQADHVLSHNSGGPHAVENYLAAHKLCNGYRWDYSPEEFQWILKIGVWARNRMRKRHSRLDKALLAHFFDYEVRRQERRKHLR